MLYGKPENNNRFIWSLNKHTSSVEDKQNQYLPVMLQCMFLCPFENSRQLHNKLHNTNLSSVSHSLLLGFLQNQEITSIHLISKWRSHPSMFFPLITALIGSFEMYF
jgi:hypothetical protein